MECIDYTRIDFFERLREIMRGSEPLTEPLTMSNCEDTAKRIYDSVQPSTGPYGWAHEMAKSNKQKFVDKDKMWEAIRDLSIGGGVSSTEQDGGTEV